ncbi:MAG: DUF362 domain-containing protein [Candidatus Limivicinus sp.]
MRINTEKCVGCGSCVPYCPVHALSVVDRKACCDQKLCTECNACYRSPACRFGGLEPAKLDWPRTVRSLLSDVFTEYCGVAGRGTEEMKTNDVTGRFKHGEIGLAIEFGRPNVGSTFRDVQKMSRRMAQMGGKFEEKNPVTHYMNPETGDFPEELLDEYVISAIIEVSFPLERLTEVLAAIREVSEQIDAVFSLDIVTKLRDDGSNPVREILDREGIFYRPNCKINVGLGKPAYDFSK